MNCNVLFIEDYVLACEIGSICAVFVFVKISYMLDLKLLFWVLNVYRSFGFLMRDPPLTQPGIKQCRMVLVGSLPSRLLLLTTNDHRYWCLAQYFVFSLWSLSIDVLFPLWCSSLKVEQLHKIFKLCGSPSDEYWKKSKLPHATIFKPQQSYKRCIAETFKDFPPSALVLIETLLAIDPAERRTATDALESEVCVQAIEIYC